MERSHMFPKSVAQYLIVELNKLIKSQNELQNLIVLEKIIDTLGDYTLSDFASNNFTPVLKKLETIKTIIDEKPRSVQVEFDKIIHMILDKPIKKKPYVVVLSDSILSLEELKEKENKKLKEILDILKRSQKKKDEMETLKMRLLSNEKEKQRVDRMKKNRERSLKKYLQEKKDKKVKVNSNVKRK